MAGGADDEGLASFPCHELCPRGLRLAGAGEVGEFSDLVGFHRGWLLAPFALPCQEPGDQFSLAGPGRVLRAVADDRPFLPPEGDAAEPCDQWFPAGPFDVASKQRRGPLGVAVTALYLAAIFVTVERCRRERLEHGGLHDPFQPVQSPDVSGQQVVLDDAPVLRPVGADDRVVVAVFQRGAGRGFAALQVGGALGLDHRFRHAELDCAVEPAAAAGYLAVVVGHGDLVAEEFRRLGAGVRDQGLFLAELQLEVIVQELGEAGLDLLGLGFRSGEPEEVSRRRNVCSAAAGSRDRWDPRSACCAAAGAVPALRRGRRCRGHAVSRCRPSGRQGSLPLPSPGCIPA